MITQENIPYTADEIKAMVKTCEKYNKAREKARELMDKGYDVLMPEIFPELNESEDEKIKREIVAYINELADLKNEKIPTKWLDWLEKQGEFDDNIITRDDEILQAISVGLTDVAKDAGWSDFGGIPIVEIQEWLEKQNKEEYALKSFRDEDVDEFMQYIEKQAKAYEFNLPNRGYDIYAFAKDILHWLENQGEQKTKPKFKLRDWIVDDVGYYWRVTKVLSNHYELEGDDGVESMPTIKWTDEKFHLWTIDDAKKGDILVVDGIWIVEFDKKRTNGCPWNDASILTSFEYDMDDDICTPGSHIFYKEIWPASREDIDLFKKKRNEYLASNSHNESKFKVGDKV